MALVWLIFGYWLTADEISLVNTNDSSTMIAELETLAVFISLKGFFMFACGK